MADAVALRSIAREISLQAGVKCEASPEGSVSGGSINTCVRWPTNAGPLFVKTATERELPAFEAEADGLRALEKARAVRVPRVRAIGAVAGHAFLALDWLESGPVTASVEAELGRQLAEQHRVTGERFGWHRDNFIGRTPQANGWCDDWVTFWRERRLAFQLDLAIANGYGTLLESRGGRLIERLPALLAGHEPEPSLLHGDLWGGNWMAGTDGQPRIFDPAVYLGDREADLAMTHLFGGFGAAFYRAYEAAWPLPPGHAVRRELYNLYHVLNHANLFGSGYASQARSMIDRLLAETSG